LKEGINKINPNIPVMTIPNEDQALDYIYENPRHGALYTIMCDVVARALDKIRELKEREEKETDKKVLA
jgi:cyanophycin synthetase